MSQNTLGRGWQWIHVAVQKALKETSERLTVLKNASYRVEKDAGDLLEEVYRLEAEVQKLDETMNGKKTKLQVGTAEVSVLENRFFVARTGLSTTYGPTSMHKENLQLGIEELKPVTEQVRTLKKTKLPARPDVWLPNCQQGKSYNLIYISYNFKHI